MHTSYTHYKHLTLPALTDASGLDAKEGTNSTAFGFSEDADTAAEFSSSFFSVSAEGVVVVVVGVLVVVVVVVGSSGLLDCGGAGEVVGGGLLALAGEA